MRLCSSIRWVHLAGAVLLASTLPLSCSRERDNLLEPTTDYSHIADFSYDAIILAGRQSTSPWIDIELTAAIDDALNRTRHLRPEFAAIHPRRDLVGWSISARASPHLAFAWRYGRMRVGDHYLDSLAAVFHLESIQEWSWEDHFTLTFAYPMNTRYVAELYDRSFNIYYAGACCGDLDGDRIWAFAKSDRWHIVYSEGRGDCPSGCTERTYFYVEVPPRGPGQVVDEWDSVTMAPPRTHRWNIPWRYPGSCFGTVDTLFSCYRHADWWVRRHAVEATRDFLDDGLPSHWWEDDNEIWYQMLAELQERRDEVVRRLRFMRSDPDADVRESVARALEAM
ncbi:MAG: hypothetical protein KAY32_00650 [Candidatus Eisenbacteria sp.]|nr:hypothetical protein [Candidatus Eisenbacteria bacterium]